MPLEQMMKRVVEAWGQSDLGPLYEVLGEDVIWKSGLSVKTATLPFGGEYRGRESVVALLSKFATAYFFTCYRTKDITACGEIVWGLFDAEGTYAPIGGDGTRRSLRYETAIRWQVRDGKIIVAHNFFDTASFLEQLGATVTVHLAS